MSMYPAKYMAEVTVNIVCVVDAYVVEKKMDIILIKMKPYNYQCISYFKTEGHGFNWASSIVYA